MSIPKKTELDRGLKKEYNQLNKVIKLQYVDRLKNVFFQSTSIFLLVLVLIFIITAVSTILTGGMSSFVEGLLSKEIQYSLRLSMTTSAIATLICFLIATPISYFLQFNNIRAKALCEIILDIPLALPHIASGLALLMLFGSTRIGELLNQNGLEFIFTKSGIIVTLVFVNISYMIKMIKASFADIDCRYEFVARTLGCTKFQAFIKVILPLAKQGIISAIVITFSRALSEFGAVLMVAGAVRMKTETLPISIFLNMSTGDLDLAMTSASILIVVSIFCLTIFQMFTRGNKETDRSNMFY